MKKQTITTPKIAIGILIGTALIMGIIGFMFNMVLHPFIIMLVLIVLFVVSGIMFGAFMGYKGILIVIASFVFGWFGFNAYYKHACGPNSADVKVMKPMAQAISDYIIKHGVPESLEDIPDLPYGLVGCERDKEYDYQENCKFKNQTIELYFRYGKYMINKKMQEEVNMEMRKIVNNITETGLLVDFKKKNNSFIQLGKIKLYSGKTSGICKPWRQ